MLRVSQLSGFNKTFSPYDADAQTFFTAASITDATQKSAWNQFVLDTKAASIYSKFIAFYPYIGGDATKHSFNAINTSLYQMTWVATVTHNANGITGNGSSGYGDTGLNASSVLTLNDVAIGSYSRTNSAVATADMGISASGSSQIELWAKYSDNKAYGELWKTADTDEEIAVTVTDSLGMTVVTRRSSTDMELYRNGSSLGNATTGAVAGTRPNLTLAVCALKTSGGASSFSARNFAFHFVSTGLTDADVSALYTAAQAMQTTLSRNV